MSASGGVICQARRCQVSLNSSRPAVVWSERECVQWTGQTLGAGRLWCILCTLYTAQEYVRRVPRRRWEQDGMYVCRRRAPVLQGT